MIRKITAAALIALLIASCVKDVDFNQIDDIEFDTKFQVSLLHFNAKTSLFLDELNNEVLFLSDTTDLPLFYGTQNEKYLYQADFMYKINNTFNRNISIQYKFLNDNNQEVYVFDPMIIFSNVVDFQQIQIVQEEDIPQVLNSEKVVINIVMETSTQPLDKTQNMEIDVQSAAQLYYKVAIDE